MGSSHGNENPKKHWRFRLILSVNRDRVVSGLVVALRVRQQCRWRASPTDSHVHTTKCIVGYQSIQHSLQVVGRLIRLQE